MRRVVAVPLLALMLACSDGGEPAQERFAARAAIKPGASTSAPEPPPLRLPPPARMWAGTESAEGSTRTFCLRGRCIHPREPAPRFLVAPTRGLLTFALHKAPLEARLQLRTPDGERVGEASLNPGTLMAYGIDLEPGRYVLTLVAEWEDAEARWLFRVRVSAKASG